MRFGINLFPTAAPTEKAASTHFDEALRLAQLADELGYHHVKTVEHYFTPYGGYSPDPVTFLAAAAARTRRVRLVTGAVIPAFSHPIKLAGKLAMLDNLSHGRLDVGFGRAFLPPEFEAFQISMDESRARFDEGIEVCRRLWSEENVVWQGRFHQFGPVTMLPRPYQRPHPPILVATATTPASCVAAGRSGYGLMMVPSINKPEKLQEMLALYRKSREEAGHDPEAGDVHFSYSCYVAADSTQAYERGKLYSENTHQKLVDAVADWAKTRSADYPGYENIVERVGRGDFDKSLAEDKVMVGTPDEVAARLRRVRDWYGDVTISLQVISGNMPYEESASTMRLFAAEVLPRFTHATS